MGTTARATGLAAAYGIATLFGAAAPASAAPASAAGHAAHAVFAQTDNPGGNAVVAYDRGTDGRLRQAGTYPTDGLGGVLTGSVVDHLASQGSLAYDRAAGLLYAVNAGSDTITVFEVHGDHLTRHQVIGSGGAFPVSIAVHRNLVYVLNARDGGTVQGFLRAGHTLVRVPSWHRSLGLDPTATPEFTHTPGQIAFTPDGTRLLVTTKANGSAIDVYAVDTVRGPSATPTVTPDPGAVPFALTFDAHGHAVLAEAGTNAVATLDLRPDGTLRTIARAATGQAATCWIVGAGTGFYASNAASGNLSGYRLTGDGALTALGTTGTDPGTVDAAATPDGRYLYAQAGGPGTIDAYRVGADGSLTPLGAVTVPGAAGGEGIVAS